MALMWAELKRRNVVRVAIAYAIAAWLVLQVTDTVVPILELPDWISRAVLLLLVIGFVVSLIVAWVYELTPEGVKREKDVDRSQSNMNTTGRKLDFVIIGVLAVTLGFFALDRFVWHEYDAEPVAATGELEKSIAVLPFDNRSADETDVYFVDGIHDDILTQLHKLSGFDKVISRTSVERYRDTDVPIPDIAAELGVIAILEGGVQRAGDSIRVTVQLIEAASDKHLWAEDYERKLTTENIFAIQREIAVSIATALQATLTENEEARLSNIPTRNLEAYDKYLLGRQALTVRTLPELRRANRLFEEAVSLDPEFTLAYVGLADSINLLLSYGEFDWGNVDQVSEALSRAEIAANQALILNDQLGEAYAALGYTNWFRGELDVGERNFTKALELSPNYVHAYRWYAHVLWDTNRPEEALENMLVGIALDPLDLITQVMLGEMFDINGRSDEALASYSRTLDIDEDYLSTLYHIAYHYQIHGEFAKAIIWNRKTLHTYPEDRGVFFGLWWQHLSLGDIEQAEKWSYWVVELGSRFDSLKMNFLLNYRKRDYAKAADTAREVLSLDPWCVLCKLAISNHYLVDEKPGALIGFLQANAKELFDRDRPRVTPQNVSLVPALAWAFQETGDKDRANRIIEIGLQVTSRAPRQAVRNYGVGITDMRLHGIAGRRDDAIGALRNAVSSGGKAGYLYELGDPTLASFDSDPEFIAIRNEIESELEAQYKYIQELERNGELAPLPTQFQDPM